MKSKRDRKRDKVNALFDRIADQCDGGVVLLAEDGDLADAYAAGNSLMEASALALAKAVKMAIHSGVSKDAVARGVALALASDDSEKGDILEGVMSDLLNSMGRGDSGKKKKKKPSRKAKAARS